MNKSGLHTPDIFIDSPAEQSPLELAISQVFKNKMVKYELQADVTVSSATSQVDITGLSIGKDDELLLVLNIVNGTSGTSGYALYVNENNTATNYYNQYISASNTSVSASLQNNGQFCTVVGISEQLLAMINIKITDSGYVACQSKGTSGLVTTSGVFFMDTNTISTFTVSSITQFSIVGGTNQIGAGTRFQLYRIGSAA